MYYKFYQNSIGHPSYDDYTGQTALEHYDVLNGGKISVVLQNTTSKRSTIFRPKSR